MVVGIGEVLWDMLPTGKQVGGAPANFAYHVSQFGLPGCVVSAVGRDALGRELIENLDSKGITRHIAETAYPTGTVGVELDTAGIPVYDIRENVAWDYIPYDDALQAIAENTTAVCFGSLAQRNTASRTSIMQFLDSISRTTGEALVVFDANLRLGLFSEEILRESMIRSNILKINDEELDVISGMFELPASGIQDRCRLLLERFGLRILILTCGINGSYVFTSGQASFLPTPIVEVADTVGAGDSFTAAFIASILKGKTVAQAHDCAVQTSAFVCTRKGATPLLPAQITGLC